MIYNISFDKCRFFNYKINTLLPTFEQKVSAISMFDNDKRQ